MGHFSALSTFTLNILSTFSCLQLCLYLSNILNADCFLSIFTVWYLSFTLNKGSENVHCKSLQRFSYNLQQSHASSIIFMYDVACLIQEILKKHRISLGHTGCIFGNLYTTMHVCSSIVFICTRANVRVRVIRGHLESGLCMYDYCVISCMCQ